MQSTWSKKKGRSTEDRFWEKVDRRSDEECWEWQASLTPEGYGQFHYEGAWIGAHRASYAMHFAAMSTVENQVDHLCRNRRCVNPAHLELVPRAVNTRRAGRSKKVCKRGHEYTPDNTIWQGSSRSCRACTRLKVPCRTCGALRSRSNMKSHVSHMHKELS